MKRNFGYGISNELAIVVPRNGKISKECKGCRFFYGEDSFKPIYDRATLYANGKNPAYNDLGLYCEYCQDKKMKSGVWDL
jgi:hypothetical protein